jgi:predicted transport protein
MDKAIATMLANLQKNTGKSLEEWVTVVRAQNFTKHGEIIKFLKTEHNFTHGFANLVAHESLQSHAAALAETTDLVAEQYKGKDGLWPVYQKLMAEIERFGDDVEVAPKKAYVSLRRNKQFALIQPSTKTRIDIGINVKGVAPTGRLEASGSSNAMCSHLVRIETVEDVTPEVIGWLRQAYEIA